MTPRAPRRAITPRLVASATLLGALVVSGCGTQDALVGLHPAPAEQTTSAPLDTEGAAAIATRLLAAVDAPAAEDAKAAAAARAEVLTGDALLVANAVAARGATDAATTELATAPEPTVVAQSQGRTWPRAILAATLDEATNTQYLHVLVSEEPNQPFRVTASVPMFAGAELPSLGEQLTGAPLLDSAEENGLPVAPADAVKAYAAALAYPKPAATDVVATDDDFASALKASTAAQAKGLGKLATLAQVHEPLPENAVTFRLADGGAVTFTLIRRTDTITAGAKAQAIGIPSEYAALVGKKKAAKSLTLTSLQPVVMVVPASGEAHAIGVGEELVAGKAR